MYEVVTAIKSLNNNESPGVCSVLPEMQEYGGVVQHAMHRQLAH